MSELVELEIRDAVGTIALNRPEKLNAINDAMLEGLRRAISTIGGDPTIGAAVLHGRGRAFSAGADITAMSSMDEPSFARTIGLFTLTRLAFLSPVIVDAVVEGRSRAVPNLQMLMTRLTALSLCWKDQERLFDGSDPHDTQSFKSIN